MTLADLQYYNEIVTVASILKKNLTDAEYPNLSIWMNQRMGKIPELMALDKKLKDMIALKNI